MKKSIWEKICIFNNSFFIIYLICTIYESSNLEAFICCLYCLFVSYCFFRFQDEHDSLKRDLKYFYELVSRKENK